MNKFVKDTLELFDKIEQDNKEIEQFLLDLEEGNQHLVKNE